MRLIWDGNAWEDYLWWQQNDRKTLKRINLIIKDIQRGGDTLDGIGKPEPLKHALSGYFSRRITGEHRIVYKIVDNKVLIACCRHHYK